MQDKLSIIRAINREGLTYKEAAIAFQISIKAIQNWKKEFAAENAELGTCNQEALNKKKDRTTSQYRSPAGAAVTSSTGRSAVKNS